MTGKLLVIDIGNTNIVLGVYGGANLLAHWRLDTKQRRTEDEMAISVHQLFQMRGLEMKSVEAVAISCVAPPVLQMVERFCKKSLGCEPLIVGPGIKTGVVIAYDNPKEVGADRIVNVVGALAKYKPPMILVDFGTAITFDAVSAKSDYLGGAIVPGVRMSLNALYHAAAKLPEVEFSQPPSIIGKNTVHSMQAGAYFGYASLVDGIVTRMKEAMGAPSAKVVATGGEANMVKSASVTIEVVEEHLTLEGLRIIYERNRG